MRADPRPAPPGPDRPARPDRPVPRDRLARRDRPARPDRPACPDRPAPAGPGAKHPRLLLAAGAAVAVAALAAYLSALAAHPLAVTLKGFDLHVYLGGARIAATRPGLLYSWTYDGHPGIKFTYPPFAALLFRAGLAVPPRGLMDGVTAVSVLALTGTVAVAFRALGWRGAPRAGATLLVAGLALWTEPVQRALFLGQVEIVLMAVVTWDLSQPAGRRWRGAATGLAAGVKLVPLLFIGYLLVTRQLRAAAVATAAFVLSVAVGFAALPTASARWWLGGDFLRAGRTGFVGGQPNQSLRGLATRLAGSVAGGSVPWLVLALAAGVAGLAAAAVLYRRRLTFAAFLTVALTALLVSPISWDQHWVWVAPGLALLADAAVRAAGRARAAWWALAAGVAAVFGAWPDFWRPQAGLLGGGVIGYAPATAWAYGDNPAYLEYHWHGLQLLAGNAELLAGLAAFAVALGAAGLRGGAGRRRPSR